MSAEVPAGSSEVTCVMYAWSFRGTIFPWHTSSRCPAQSMSVTSWTATFAGHRTMSRESVGIGAWVSRTIAWRLHDAWFCAPSLAVQVTLVDDPTGSCAPEVEQVAVAPPQLSVAWAVNVPAAPPFTHSR